MTIAQIATRTGEPQRRVRHQIDRLLEAGLVLVDAETPRRNARERHYRAVSLARIAEEIGAGWSDEQRRKIAHSIIKVIAEMSAGRSAAAPSAPVPVTPR